MSVPRITEILEAEIQTRFDSEDAATRQKATADYLAFATLQELKKIRLMLEEETGIEIEPRDLAEHEENL